MEERRRLENRLSPESSLEDGSRKAPNVEEAKPFDCKYCTKRFGSKQALGGHQNAHKLERNLENNVARAAHNLSAKIQVYLGQPSRPFGCYDFGRSPIENLGYYPGITLGPYSRLPAELAHFNGGWSRPFTSEGSWASNGPYVPATINSNVVVNNRVSRDFFAENDDKNKNEDHVNQKDGNSGLDLTLKL